MARHVEFEFWIFFQFCGLFLYPPHNKVVGGYIGFTPSVRLSVRPASVSRPSRIPCPLCSFYSSGWIHFIFMHLIKQLQKVCRMQSFLQNVKIWNLQFFKICNFDFVLFWLGIWCESLVWVIMGRRRVSQNAGVLVVLVSTCCEILIWNLLYTSSRQHHRSSLSFIAIRTFWPLQPKVCQIRFDIPEASYWDVVFKFVVVVALNALFNIHFGFNQILQTFFTNF